MKIQLETITSQVNQSFSLMLNPRMNDLFFWHIHPEYELVYIEGANGTRHVGNHISAFQENDLVLIGSNIPHLNFDYGVKSEYNKVVVHFKKEFIENHLQGIPELFSIFKLFDLSRHGIAFKGPAKKLIGTKLFQLERHSNFDQYLKLLETLMELANIPDFELLHQQPFISKHSEREHGKLRTIYAFVDKNYHRRIELKEIAGLSNMTKEAFCRYFKKRTQYTFIEFLNRYRISHAKRRLMAGSSVSEACYSSGYESLSYFNRMFRKITCENPSEFRKRYL